MTTKVRMGIEEAKGKRAVLLVMTVMVLSSLALSAVLFSDSEMSADDIVADGSESVSSTAGNSSAIPGIDDAGSDETVGIACVIAATIAMVAVYFGVIRRQ